MRNSPRSALAAAALLLATAVPAKAQVDRAPGPPPAAVATRAGTLLTREELAASGARTTYDALRRLRRDWLRFDRAHSLFPSVYVDGRYVGEPDVLREQEVGEVLWIQYSDRREALARFPSLRDVGAIHVSTRLPLSAVHPSVPRPSEWEHRGGVSLSTFARRAMGRLDYFGDAPNAAGLGVGVETPVRTNMLVTASVSHGRLERSCPCPSSVPRQQIGVRLTTVGAGLKMRGATQEVYAPYLVLGVELMHARWDAATGGGEPVYPVGENDWGYGGVGGIGVDMRLASRLLLFGQGDVTLARFPREWAGPTRSFRVGTTLLLGRAP